MDEQSRQLTKLLRQIERRLGSIHDELQRRQKQKETEANEDQADSAEKQPLAVRAEVVDLPVEEIKQLAASRHDEKWQRKQYYLNLATLIVLGLTLAGVGLQWSSMDSTLSEMQKQTTSLIESVNESKAQTKAMADSVKETTKQTKVAQGQLDEAIKNREASERAADASNALALRSLEASIAGSRNDQRAWIGRSAYSKATLEPGKPFTVRVELANTGKTPAIDMRSSSVIELRRGQSTPAFDYRGLPRSRDVVLPGNPVYTTLALPPLEQVSVDAIKAGTQTIYVFGVMCYADVFGARHWTSYCGKYLPNQEEFESCETGNDVDREGQREHPSCRTD